VKCLRFYNNDGILISKYGASIFFILIRKEVLNILGNFTSWRSYEHKITWRALTVSCCPSLAPYLHELIKCIAQFKSSDELENFYLEVEKDEQSAHQKMTVVK